jgi:replication factor C large subunit
MQHTLFTIKERHEKAAHAGEKKAHKKGCEELRHEELCKGPAHAKPPELWIEKHRPKTTAEIAGQDKAVGEVTNLIEDRKPGRAIFISGPPGTGKTLLAETIAAERGWALAVLNASDSRGAKQIEEFCAREAENRPLFSSGKLILIDEADGISGHERGAAGAIANLIKKSKFPVIVIANDPYIQKLKPVKAVSVAIKFSRLHQQTIAKRLGEICKKEGIEADASVLKALAGWSHGDMRSAISDLQMAAAGRKKIELPMLESLGHRERAAAIHEILPALFRSGTFRAGRKAMADSDADSEDIFWWVENNLEMEFSDPVELAGAFDALSMADLLRSRISVQQNWRFRAYMSDILAGISSLRKGKAGGWIKYEPPRRMIMMGRTKFSRALRDSAYAKAGGKLHVSSAAAIRDYGFLLGLLLKKDKGLAAGLKLTPEEVAAICGRRENENAA